MSVNAAALALFAFLWPARRRHHVLAALCSYCPAALLLCTGEDTALFLRFATIGLLLLESEWDLTASLVLSLCAAKFHLALGIPVFLAARRRWMAILGGLIGGLVQLAVSFAVEGRGWPAALFHLSSVSEFSPMPSKMPNLWGLSHWLPYAAGIEVTLAVLVLAAVWLIAARSTLPVGAAAAVTGGLLTGHHAYVYDTILLLPALVLVSQSSFPGMLRYWSLLLFAPIPYILLMMDRPSIAGQVIIGGFCLATLAVLAVRAGNLHAEPERLPVLQPAVPHFGCAPGSVMRPPLLIAWATARRIAPLPAAPRAPGFAPASVRSPMT